MKTNKIITRQILLFASWSATIFQSGVNLHAQETDNKNDKTLSPYFFVQSNDSQTDQLPLKSTQAKVNIAGIIADVTVVQEYKNEGTKPLEAIYIFPASTRAAVYSMVMTIGDRTIQANIKEREQARQEYETAKSQGKSASLLEQQRPNVFQMNVANIMPGDLIKVEMKYTESLIPENGIYEFVYPTVVGPRYSNKPEENAGSGDKWVANPYTPENKKPMFSFNIDATINAGIPIKDLKCDSHPMDIQYLNQSTAKVSLKPGNDHEGNRDFILKYRLQGEAIQSGLLLFNGKEENYFLAMLQPPQRITPDQIPAREYIFIVDVSGSMHGFPLEISKKLLRDLIGNLRAKDRFNVILFAGASNLLAEESIEANKENISKAIDFINQQQGSGGTELLPALNKALSIKSQENMSRSFIIATDGYVDIEKDAFDLVRKNLGNANFFAFGIGTSVNRYLIEGLAHAGSGEPFIIEKEEKALEIADRFRKYVSSPVLTNIRVSFSGFDTYDVEPLTIPDLFAERPVVIFGKWRGEPKGKIILQGQSAKNNFSSELLVASNQPSDKNSALKYLWARKRIQLLDDYAKVGKTEELKKEITELGLNYHLLTEYTSFIAVDSKIRNTTGQTEMVQQPLPLPENVSNYAVVGYGVQYKRAAFAPAQVQKSVGLRTTSDEKFSNSTKELEEITTINAPATFSGGNLESFKLYLLQHFSCPAELKGKNVKGKIRLRFTVEKSGKITRVDVLKSLHPAIDQQLLKLITESKSWKPAIVNGVVQSQKYTITLNIAAN